METKFKKISIIYFIAILLIAIIFMCGYAGVQFLQNDVILTILIQLVVMLGFPMLMYSLFVSKNFKTTLKDTGIKKISFKILVFSILLGIILYFINTFVSNFFSSILSLFGYEQIGRTEQTYIDYKILFKEFALTAILPGICEEFMFRGLILHAGKKYKNTRICLVLSSLLFGLTHLNINQFFYASIMGAMMGYVTIIADSIIPSMIMHFMNNFLSTYFYYGYYLKSPLAVKYNQFLVLLSNNFLMFIVFTTLLITLLILMYIGLCKLIKKDKLKAKQKENLHIDGDNKHENLLSKIYARFVDNKTDTSRDVSSQQSTLQLQPIQIPEYEEISSTNSYKQINSKLSKSPSLSNNLFWISSIILGSLITIFTFIWGVI